MATRGSDMVTHSKAIHLAGSVLHSSCHACAFFRSREEEYRVLLPFLQEGFENREKLFQIVDRDHRAERLRRIAQLGIDVPAAEQSGQLEVRPWDDAHLRNGRFNQFDMLDLVDEVLGNGESGFGLTRFWANMEWSLTDTPGVEDIIEYETRLNHVMAKFDDVVICTYDVNRFSASVVMDILRTHPQAIIGGTLQENPFYVPPDEFLTELRHRAAAS
jgi:MEDS: MEthanogen/methylotroph, DcmR Sensory domain